MDLQQITNKTKVEHRLRNDVIRSSSLVSLKGTTELL